MFKALRQKYKNSSGSLKLMGKNAVLIYALRIIQKILNITIVYFLVRSVDQELFGTYHFILSIVALLAILSLPGLGNALMQSVARGYKGTYRHSLPYTFGGSLLISLFLCAGGFWYYGTDPVMATGLFIAAVFSPFFFGLNYWKNLYKGIEDFKTITQVGIILSFVRSTLMIAVILIFPGSILWPLAMYFMPVALQNIYFTARSLKKVGKDEPIEEESFKYGVKTTAYSSLNTLANQIDKLLIFFFLSPAALAIFVTAEKIPEMIKNLIQDLGTVASPYFAKQKKYTLKINTALNLFALVMAVLIIGFAFTIMPWAIIFIFGDDYADAILYAQLLMVSIAIGNAAVMRMRYISSKLDTKSFKDVTISISAARVICSLILVPLYGLWGAVLSAIIYRLVLITATFWVIKKRYQNSEEQA